MKKHISLLLALVLLLTSCGGGSGASAATMHLKRTEGTVGVADGEGKELEPRDNLGLYSGYGVDTSAESYAWIDLDAVKLTKLDQDSEIEITQDGKNLEIEVKSGSLFFNVTEPLKDDETMTIHSSTMAVGIRGTCGWVALSEDESTLTVGLLEGKVECSNGDSTVTVSAGERGTIPAGGEITVTPFSSASLPAFVKAELEEDTALAEKIEAASGIDVLASVDPMRLRDMYTYSRIVQYGADGEFQYETEYFPDEQGRIRRDVTHISGSEGEGVFEYIYNGAGTLSQYINDGIIYTVTEDTTDHRTMECVSDSGGRLMKYTTYYDEQGYRIRAEQLMDGESVSDLYCDNTYDAGGKLVRSDIYLSDGSSCGYVLYKYD